MDVFEIEFLNNPIYLWLMAVVMIFIILMGAQVMQSVIRQRISRQKVGDEGLLAFLTSLTIQTRGYILLVVALYLASLLLELPKELEGALRVLVITGMLLQFGFWGTSFINYWVSRRIRLELERDNTNATTLGGLSLVVRIIFWAIIILLILENITGMEVNTLVASLGVTGVAVALAVQNILGDLFASLSITLDKPFVIGDSITVGEFNGTVEHIGLKSTRIRSLTGEQLIFSNSDLLGSRIRNYKRMDRRRVAFFLNVNPRTDPEKVERIPAMLEQIIGAHEQVSFDRAHFKDFNASNLNFEVVYFIENPDYLLYMDTQQAVNLQIMRRFAAAGIEFAYPAQVVYLQENGANGKRGEEQRPGV